MSKYGKKTDRLVVSKNLSQQRLVEESVEPAVTPKQRRKRDALDLAELIYDIFQDSLSNDKITDMKEEETPDA